MVFHLNLRDSKYSQVSMTLHGILADLNNLDGLGPASILNSSRSINELLEIVPSAPITSGITVTNMFHNFFSSLVRSKYLSQFFFLLRVFHSSVSGWSFTGI